MVITDDDFWIFSGYPGHFIGAASCKFHLTTFVNRGTWMVSTVGDYTPSYADKAEISPLGIDDESYFETMVFPTRRDSSSSFPTVTNWAEEETRWYSNHAEATNGHIELCRKYHSITRGQ
jgi:hypothetical protein